MLVLRSLQLGATEREKEGHRRHLVSIPTLALLGPAQGFHLPENPLLDCLIEIIATALEALMVGSRTQKVRQIKSR